MCRALLRSSGMLCNILVDVFFYVDQTASAIIFRLVPRTGIVLGIPRRIRGWSLLIELRVKGKKSQIEHVSSESLQRDLCTFEGE